jgi:hypothetical protein
LLTSFSKVLEKALYSRLTEYLYNNKRLAENQYGFRKGLTADAIFKLIYEILDTLNNKMKTGSVFCDLQKSFDTVHHKVLLDKLQYYGSKAKAKTLLESYLQNRYQRVLISNSYSNIDTLLKWTKINQWVPQGSILGPLLFLIDINDLLKAVEPTAIPIMFADDSSIIIKSLNNTQLQSDLNAAMCQINKWFQENLITLNLNKTYFLQFINKSTDNSHIQIKVENKLIATVKETKFLGLIIDKLTWKGHINYIIPKLSSACYVMRTVKPHVSHNALKVIY